MLEPNLYNACAGDDQNATFESQPFGETVSMNARLNENDRGAVDFLLNGDSHVAERESSPMAHNAFMERVSAVRRLMSLLDAMPADEPSKDLLEATMRRLPVMGLESPGQPSAGANP